MRNWINLFEAFDKLVPIRWMDHSNDDLNLYQADFQIDEGHFVVQFKRPYYDSTYTISFTRNNELKLSGTGSANVVLATVMQAIREFVQARDPQYMRIDMDKTEGSRNKLYPKLAAMMLREFPQYAMTAGETRRHHNMQMSRPAKETNWEAAFAASPAPQKELPRAPRSMEELMADDALLAELLGENREVKINEGVEKIEIGHGAYKRVIRVLRNPTANALTRLGETARQGIVRFIINEDKIWFWDAYDSTHVQVGESLGLDVYDIVPLSKTLMTGVMKMEPGSYDFEVGHVNAAGNMSHGMTKGQWKVLCANPIWARYAKTMGLYPQYKDMDL